MWTDSEIFAFNWQDERATLVKTELFVVQLMSSVRVCKSSCSCLWTQHPVSEQKVSRPLDVARDRTGD
jgi:hypothetical protein